NQAVDVGGHDKEVTDGSGAGIPVRMRRPARHKHGRAGLRLDFIPTNLDTQRPFQDVPGLIGTAVQMARRDEARRSGRTAWIPPFGHDEGIIDRTYNAAGKWRRYRGTHPCA